MSLAWLTHACRSVFHTESVMFSISCNTFEISLPTTESKPFSLFLSLLNFPIKIFRVFESYATHLTQELGFQGSATFSLLSTNIFKILS